MSYYLAGLAVTHLHEAHKARPPVRAVLVAMASFVPDNQRRDPVCFASRESLAERTGLSTRTVASALIEAQAHGHITRVGTASRRGTVRWRLDFLADLVSADEGRRKRP